MKPSELRGGGPVFVNTPNALSIVLTTPTELGSPSRIPPLIALLGRYFLTTQG